jgi:hypothetical protein
MLANNKDNIKVLTPFGWTDFSGVRKIKNDILLYVLFEDSTELKVLVKALQDFPF